MRNRCFSPDHRSKSHWPIHFRIISAVFLICTTIIVLAESYDLNQQHLAQIKQEFGARAYKRVKRWDTLIKDKKTLSDVEKLILVNRFINKVKYKSDRDHWGKEDYWATPLETLVTNGGDCEDFSIAKYFTLRAMGVATSKMRLIYVKATTVQQAHMVLAYYQTPGSDPWILDNLVPEIKKGSQRKDLIPVYSFNGDYLWLAKEMKGRGEIVGSSRRVGYWKKLRSRMQKEKRKIAGRP